MRGKVLIFRVFRYIGDIYHAISDYRLLHVSTDYYMLPKVTTGYYRLIQVTIGYFRSLELTTGYYKQTYEADE